jgi:predicted phage tail protein
MDEGSRASGEELTDGKRTPEQVREEIEQTRQELGDTAAALAEKADVKAQARRAADNAKQTLAAEAQSIKDSVAGKATQTSDSIASATPDSAGEGAQRAKTIVRENRPAVIALAALAGGYLLGRRRA